jgi:nucleotide-binding universal stress UspA family protein
MMSAILESRAPVLVLPKKRTPVSCKRILVAWNRGKTESLLVHNTLELLKKADEVILLSVGKNHHHGPSTKDMVDYLKSHGIKASHKRVLAKEDGQGLLQAYKQEKADLLLCGAYTRGKMRELVFGGMTRFLLEKSDFPIVFQHI